MCDIRKKLILFDHAISRFAESRKTQRYVDIDEVLKLFSTTQIMKLMYFTCLQCVTSQSSYKETLFFRLDNWIAYKNGPVEYDVYWSLSYLPTIQKNFENPYRLRKNADIEKIKTFYDIDNIDFCSSNAVTVRQRLIDKFELSEAVELISSGIDIIINNKDFPFDNVDKLIGISHSGMLWGAAQHNDNKKMITNNIYLLKEEKERIKKAFSIIG